MPIHRRLSAGLAGLLSLLILMFAPAALAQQTDAGGEPAYGSLADLLENEASRNALIEELRGLEAARGDQAPAVAPSVEGAAPPAEIAAQAPSDQRPEQVSFARRMARLHPCS